jgi:hypothetical protein
MERNVLHVQHSEELRRGARQLVQRSVAFSRLMQAHCSAVEKTERGGRKAHRLDIETA